MNKKGKSTLENLEKILRFRNYSELSIKTYLNYSKMFLNHFNTDIYHIPVKEVKCFLESYNYTSISQQNQIISSVKKLYELVVGSKLKTLNVVRPRKEKKLPKIIDAELLASKINNIKNLKHKCILALGLSCGLRVSEVVNLKWEHLDRERNVLSVVNGKGKKDRCTVLNDFMIGLLVQYWKEHKSEEYVFNGQSKKQYSTTSIQRLMKKYIHPKASYHLLRHSFATFALDNGTEIAPLSKSLGHASSITTEIYYHNSIKSLKTIKQAI